MTKFYSYDFFPSVFFHIISKNNRLYARDCFHVTFFRDETRFSIDVSIKSNKFDRKFGKMPPPSSIKIREYV